MLIRKVKRRLKKLLKQLIPHNRQYKPHGVYNFIDEYIAAVKGTEVLEIFPPYVSYLNVSDDFRKHFIGYVDTTVIAQIPAARVVVIPNGKVHTDNNYSVAIISGDNKLIGELSFDHGSRVPAKNNIFRQNYFHKPQVCKGVVCSILIGEGGIVNYSHFLVDSLSRIALVKRAGWFDKIDYFVVPSTHYDFQRDALKMLGIEESKIISGLKEPFVQADTLIATTHVRQSEHFPAWCCQFLRDEFLKYSHIESPRYQFVPNVYISRNDSAKRRVLNEDKLMEMLSKYGFASYELSKLNFQEKIALFAQADTVIATIGAGQANLVFCKEKTNVIELMADDFAQPFFSDLANKVGLNYDYQICESTGTAETFKQGEKLDLIADIAEIERKIQKITNAVSTEEISKL